MLLYSAFPTDSLIFISCDDGIVINLSSQLIAVSMVGLFLILRLCEIAHAVSSCGHTFGNVVCGRRYASEGAIIVHGARMLIYFIEYTLGVIHH